MRALVSGCTEADVRAPSALPDWTRGHVLAHVANFASAVCRQIEYALAGELIEVYDGGRPGRAAAIESDAARPAKELVGAVEESLTRLDDGWSRLGSSDWSRRTAYRDGTLADLLLCDWRETEIHAVDLDLGVDPSAWSREFCLHALTFLAPRTPSGVQLTLTGSDGTSRTFGAGEPVEVRGELTDLTAWLAGRTPIGGLTTESGELPELGPWP